MFSDDRIFDVAITFLPGIGDINAKKLISYFESSKKLFEAKLKDLKSVQGISEAFAIRLYSSFDSVLKQAEDELKYVYANDLNFVFFSDDTYPSRLRECVDSPIILYYKGGADFFAKKIISIVGTRNATKYGIEFCEKFVSDLAKKYPETIVVSGLAYGIDVTAHKAALENNLLTWAILGHSLESIYPVKHTRIAEKIVAQGGAIMCDYPHASKIDPSNFVRRNRIVAGICDALLVVESGEKGGSIITANIANNYNKDVFALPGNVNSIYSKGCNKLIKTNRANLCESFEDFEYIMSWSPQKTPQNRVIEFKYELSEKEKKVVQILSKYEFLDIDNLGRQSDLQPNELSLVLLELEMKKAITSLPGKIFSLKNN